MAEDYHKWLFKKEDERAAKRLAEATPAAAPAVGGGFGSESTFANTPAGPEDKGLLTRFGSRSPGIGAKTIDVGGGGAFGEVSTEGGAKTITVGTPIKTEPLMKPLSKPLLETELV